MHETGVAPAFKSGLSLTSPVMTIRVAQNATAAPFAPEVELDCNFHSLLPLKVYSGIS